MLKVMLCFFFSSTSKTLINHKFSLKNAFPQILYSIDNWINEGFGWIVELFESQYINISTYRQLSGSSYVKLSVEFSWCHVRHINLVKMHPESITQNNKKLVNNLNYDGVGFPVREKGFRKIERKNNICFNLIKSWL